MMLIEYIGGVLSNSLAIQSDAVHMLVDVFTLLISYFSMRAMLWGTNGDYSFGWRRIEVIGSLASVLTTWVLAAWIGLSAMQRIISIVKCAHNDTLSHCEELNAPIMLGLGCFGLLMNILLACALYSQSVHCHSHGSLPFCETKMMPVGGDTTVHDARRVRGHSGGYGCVPESEVVVVPMTCDVEDTSCSTMNITTSNKGCCCPSTHSSTQVQHIVPAIVPSSQLCPRLVGGSCPRVVAASVCCNENVRVAPAEEMEMYSYTVAHADPSSDHSLRESRRPTSHRSSRDRHNMTQPMCSASHSNYSLRSRSHHCSTLCRDCPRHMCTSHHNMACRNTVVSGLQDAHPAHETPMHTLEDTSSPFCCSHGHHDRRGKNGSMDSGGDEDQSGSDADVHSGHTHDCHGHSHDSMNMRATLLHILGDCLQALGVVMASVAVWIGNYTTQHVSSSAHSYYNLADPLLSLLFGMLTILTTLKLLSEVLHILMERVPPKINYAKVIRTLQKMSLVKGVEDLHVWAVNPGLIMLCVNVVVSDALTAFEAQQLCNAITMKCQSFGIHHSTIQVTYKLGVTTVSSA